MAFWIACSMKAIKEQIDEQPKIIKLFSINYARDLISHYFFKYLMHTIKSLSSKFQTIIQNRRQYNLIHVTSIVPKLEPLEFIR